MFIILSRLLCECVVVVCNMFGNFTWKLGEMIQFDLRIFFKWVA